MTTLDVGDTLDIAVANAVGLEVLTPLGVERLLNRGDCEHLENVCVLTQIGLQRYQTPDHHGIWALKPWQPSRDIVVAMELFDQHNGWFLVNHDISETCHEPRYYRYVYSNVRDFDLGVCLSRSTISAAHAISLAIVAAKL